jgi:short-subunit dehydrogenase
LSEWQALKETVSKDFGSIELLVLNAGVGLRGSWGDSDYFRKVSRRPTIKKVKCR